MGISILPYGTSYTIPKAVHNPLWVDRSSKKNCNVVECSPLEVGANPIFTYLLCNGSSSTGKPKLTENSSFVEVTEPIDRSSSTVLFTSKISNDL